MGYDAFASHGMVKVTRHLADNIFAQVGVSWDGVRVGELLIRPQRSNESPGLNRTPRDASGDDSRFVGSS